MLRITFFELKKNNLNRSWKNHTFRLNIQFR